MEDEFDISTFDEEPNEFQKEIISLNYTEFVEETNIKQIIIRKHGQTQTQIQNSQMDLLLRSYYGLRGKWQTWGSNALRHLKFNKCECKRKMVSRTTGTQTDIDDSE